MSFLGPQLKINWGPKRTKAYPPPPRASESWGYGWSWGRSTSHQWGHTSQFSCSGVSDSATPWTAACEASLSITNFRSLLKLCPLSRWCPPTISSSVVSFSCFHSFPASGFFPVSQFFALGGQSIGVSASASVLPMNIQDWFPLGNRKALPYYIVSLKKMSLFR